MALVRRKAQATLKRVAGCQSEAVRANTTATPTGCSWINLVEFLLGHHPPGHPPRGSFTSVKELTAAIGAFIDSWNDHPRPFARTKDADKILASIHHAKTKANVLTHH